MLSIASDQAPSGEHRLFARALDRHLAWARDFALAGDLLSALEELRDVRAISTEMTAIVPPDLAAGTRL